MLGVVSAPAAAQEAAQEEEVWNEETANVLQQAGQIVQPTFPTNRRATGYHCVAGRHMNFHNLGVFGIPATLTINFNTSPQGGDITAQLMRLQMGNDTDTSPPVDLARVSNDDTGGRLDPRIRFVNGQIGTFVLAVGLFASTGTPVCYEYRMQCTGGGCNARNPVMP